MYGVGWRVGVGLWEVWRVRRVWRVACGVCTWPVRAVWPVCGVWHVAYGMRGVWRVRVWQCTEIGLGSLRTELDYPTCVNTGQQIKRLYALHVGSYRAANCCAPIHTYRGTCF